MDSWIVCPCQRGRIDLLRRMLASLQHPRERVVIVATIPNPLTADDIVEYAGHLVLCNFAEINIARWWNAGLDAVARLAHRRSEYEVLVLSSDNVGTPHSVGIIAGFMRQHNLTMAGPNYHSDEFRFFDLTTPAHPHNRVPGGCWMLAGESGLRVDTDFRWWYSDDDFEMQCRQRSGSGVVPGTGLAAEADSPLTEEQARWAVEDRGRFVSKWGREPW